MKPTILAVSVFLLGIILGFILGNSSTSSTGISLPNMHLTCTFEGKTYKNGEAFKDDCNSCSCQNGQVTCTLMACAPEHTQ